MKTICILLTILSLLYIAPVLAKNSSNPGRHNPVEISDNLMLNLGPVTPAEATFEDGMAVYELQSRISDLKPLIPKEATFNDFIPESFTDISFLAPSSPREAAFDDELNPGKEISDEMMMNLAPSSPREADFNNCSVDPLAGFMNSAFLAGDVIEVGYCL